MAEQPQMTTQDQETNLKYLDFIQIATQSLVGTANSVYGYAKDNSGPLKPGVQSLEGTVKTVLAPVYNKYHDVPLVLLKFVDNKVVVSVNTAESHVPSVVKIVSSQAASAAKNAPEMARSVASEVKRAGVVGTAKKAYTKYEPVAEVYAASAWRKLNSLPLFPQVANVVVPGANYTAEKYNEAVCYTAEKGYAVSSYLPLVPTKKIADVFGEKREIEVTN